MDPSATTTKSEDIFSKNHRKKLEKKRVSKHLKSEHRARLHEIMLLDALRIRDRLQRSSSAVPEDALYSRLPRMFEIELFADIDEGRLESSNVLFHGPANSSADGGHDDDRSTHARCCRIVDRLRLREFRGLAPKLLPLGYISRGSGGKNVIFSNRPYDESKYSDPLIYVPI